MKLLSARKKNTSIPDFLHLWSIGVGLSVALSALSGCSHANTSALAPGVVEGGQEPKDSSSSSDTQRVASRQAAPLEPYTLPRQSLQVLMPSDEKWIYSAGVGAWSGLQRASSGEELWLYHQLARRTITVAECESAARGSLARLRHGIESAHERPFQAPAGYGGIINVILLEDGGGLVEAFSVAASRCLAACYVIEAGPGFGERMRLFVQESLPSLMVLRNEAALKRQSF